VPQLRDSLINLDKPVFESDAKEEEALYKRSLEVCCSLAITSFTFLCDALISGGAKRSS
jgi:hypothetical protein